MCHLSNLSPKLLKMKSLIQMLCLDFLVFPRRILALRATLSSATCFCMYPAKSLKMTYLKQ